MVSFEVLVLSRLSDAFVVYEQSILLNTSPGTGHSQNQARSFPHVLASIWSRSISHADQEAQRLDALWKTSDHPNVHWITALGTLAEGNHGLQEEVGSLAAAEILALEI